MIPSNMQRKDWNTAALAASERSGEAANAAGSPVMDLRQQLPDSEVTARPQRRRFTAEYKRSVVDEADAAQDAGAVGGLLRREGLYSSHLSTWRRQRRQVELEAMAPKRRGPKVVVSPLHLENRKLLAINIRLTQRLKNAELIIEVQKKVAALLGNPIPKIQIGEENECAPLSSWDRGLVRRQPVAPWVCPAPRCIAACNPSQHPGPGPRQRGLSILERGRPCSIICTRNGSATRLRWRSMPRCWTKASISVRCAPCIASWLKTGS